MQPGAKCQPCSDFYRNMLLWFIISSRFLVRWRQIVARLLHYGHAYRYWTLIASDDWLVSDFFISSSRIILLQTFLSNHFSSSFGIRLFNSNEMILFSFFFSLFILCLDLLPIRCCFHSWFEWLRDSFLLFLYRISIFDSKQIWWIFHYFLCDFILTISILNFIFIFSTFIFYYYLSDTSCNSHRVIFPTITANR